MNVHWLQQTEANVPMEDNWLGTNELQHLGALRITKRRHDWRLGRWTAKRALAAYLKLPAQPGKLAKIEIRPAPSGAPKVFIAGEPPNLTISLSHCAGAAICALAPSGDLGCDLEIIEPRSESFVSDYFTREEQAMIANAVAADRARLVTLLWSAKESALKALHEGLRLDTRAVEVHLGDVAHDSGGWTPLCVRYSEGRSFHGWWQGNEGMIRTVVADPPPEPPILLEVAAHPVDRVYRGTWNG